jgi:hypothetical protein
MKKLIYLLVLLLLLALTACSEKDNPSDVKILGYKLDQFINPDTVRIILILKQMKRLIFALICL